jgi:hypothetical protein
MGVDMTTTLEKIASIEQSRIDLLSDTDSDLATFHNAARMTRLAEMKKDLDLLWTIERKERLERMLARQQSNQQRATSARR